MLRLPDSSDFQLSLWELMLEHYYHLVVGVIIRNENFLPQLCDGATHYEQGLTVYSNF